MTDAGGIIWLIPCPPTIAIYWPNPLAWTCGIAPVFALARQPIPGAEFDHVFHHGLNRPEHGWLVCAACHGELTYGGYLAHFARIPEFRIFQARVLAYR